MREAAMAASAKFLQTILQPASSASARKESTPQDLILGR
jgi:hypothetical protein